VVKVGFTQIDYLYLFVKERAKSIPNPFLKGTTIEPVSWKN